MNHLRSLSAIFVLLISSQFTFAQNQECGTHISAKDAAKLEAFYQEHQSMATAQDSEDTIVYYPVQHVILRKSDGTGGLNPNQIPNLMDLLNSYYINAGLQFYNCGDPMLVDSDEFYNFEAGQESALCGPIDVPGAVNIYYCNTVKSSSGSGLCGYTYFPFSRRDRILMNNGCALNGSTLVHEVGHFFALYHTHGKTNTGTTDELVDGSNCETAGDNVCDTPADPNLSGKVNNQCEYTGSALDANDEEFMPDPRNIMSYSRKKCRDYLSLGQYERVSFSARNHRSYRQLCCKEEFSVELDFTPEVCKGDSTARVVANAIGGYAPYCYIWNSGDSTEMIDNQTSEEVTLTIKDRPGCSFDTSFQIPHLDDWTIAKQSFDENCHRMDGKVQVHLEGYGGEFEYQVFDTSGIEYQADSLIHNSYTLMAQDSNGCEKSLEFDIALIDYPQIPYAWDLQYECPGDTLTLALDTSLTDSLSFGFAWSEDEPWIDSSKIGLSFLAPGSLIVKTEDARNGCAVLDTLSFDQIDNPLVMAFDVFQTNLQLVLESQSPMMLDSLKWQLDHEFLSYEMQLERLFDGPSTFEICYSEFYRCFDSSYCLEVLLDSFDVQTEVEHIKCAGDLTGQINLQAKGDPAVYTYQWEDGPSGNQRTQLDNGRYRVIIEDGTGYSTSRTVFVDEPDSLKLLLTSIKDEWSGYSNGSIKLEITGGTAPYQIDWDHGAQGDSLGMLVAGDYQCVVTDANGCTLELGPFIVKSVTNNHLLEDASLTIWPNPVSERLHIQVSEPNLKLRLRDLSGKLLQTIHCESKEAIQVDMSFFNPGVYLLEFVTDYGSITRRVMKL